MKNQIIKSNNWRNTISIKNLFEDETTPELIVKLCDSLIIQLEKINKKESRSNLTADEKYNISSKIEDIVSNFQFLKELADGSIPENEWNNYDFDGDYKDLFNGYFSDVYDLGDERVLTTNNIQEKFMWVD
jgi:hypothetical protein